LLLFVFRVEAEQMLTSQLKSAHALAIESYENRLGQVSLSMSTSTVNEHVKDEPMESNCQTTNCSLQLKQMTDRLEQVQIDFGE
jgi:hypothetical protein